MRPYNIHIRCCYWLRPMKNSQKQATLDIIEFPQIAIINTNPLDEEPEVPSELQRGREMLAQMMPPRVTPFPTIHC